MRFRRGGRRGGFRRHRGGFRRHRGGFRRHRMRRGLQRIGFRM